MRGQPYDGGGLFDPADFEARRLRNAADHGSGVEPHALELGRIIRAAAPWVTSIGMLRGSRLHPGSDIASVHAVGRALDVDVPTLSDPRGEALANWLVENAERLGIQLVIWDGAEWQAGHSRDGVAVPSARASIRPHGGADASARHENHVHVEVGRVPTLALVGLMRAAPVFGPGDPAFLAFDFTAPAIPSGPAPARPVPPAIHPAPSGPDWAPVALLALLAFLLGRRR